MPDTIRDLVLELAEAAERWDPLPGGLVAVARRIMRERAVAKEASREIGVKQ